MLSPDVFQKVSETFGVSVGIATAIEYRDADEPDVTPKMTDEARTNGIIVRAIREGIYPALQRSLWRQRDRKAKTITKYRTAWKEIKSK